MPSGNTVRQHSRLLLVGILTFPTVRFDLNRLAAPSRSYPPSFTYALSHFRTNELPAPQLYQGVKESPDPPTKRRIMDSTTMKGTVRGYFDWAFDEMSDKYYET